MVIARASVVGDRRPEAKSQNPDLAADGLFVAPPGNTAIGRKREALQRYYWLNWNMVVRYTGIKRRSNHLQVGAYNDLQN